MAILNDLKRIPAEIKDRLLALSGSDSERPSVESVANNLSYLVLRELK